MSDTPEAPVAAHLEKPSMSARAMIVFHRLGPAGPLALLAASMPAIGGFLMLGSIKWSAPWLRTHQLSGILICIFVYAVLGGLALLPSYSHSVLCGWAFGFTVGFEVAMCAFVAASCLGYVIARYLSGDRVVQLINENPKSRAIYDALIGCGFWRTLAIVTLLRLPPSSPFAITNLVMAATRVHPLAYVLGTALGMAPRTGVVVFLAAHLENELNFSSPTHPWYMIGSILVTMAVLSIIGLIAKHALAHYTQATGET